MPRSVLSGDTGGFGPKGPGTSGSPRPRCSEHTGAGAPESPRKLLPTSLACLLSLSGLCSPPTRFRLRLHGCVPAPFIFLKALGFPNSPSLGEGSGPKSQGILGKGVRTTPPAPSPCFKTSFTIATLYSRPSPALPLPHPQGSRAPSGFSFWGSKIGTPDTWDGPVGSRLCWHVRVELSGGSPGLCAQPSTCSFIRHRVSSRCGSRGWLGPEAQQDSPCPAPRSLHSGSGAWL